MEGSVEYPVKRASLRLGGRFANGRHNYRRGQRRHRKQCIEQNAASLISIYTQTMKPLSIAVVLSLCFAVSGLSQAPALPAPGIPPTLRPFFQLRQFLALTDSQVSVILQNNNDYNTLSFQLQQQIQNAQAQIVRETAKEQLDPMGIGTLYVGIESACRELRDKVTTSQKQNLLILTDLQRTKLNTLVEALKLLPTISEAQSGNLLPSPYSPPFAFTGFSSAIITGVLGVTGFPPVQGCGSAVFPGNIIPANRLATVTPTGISQPDIVNLNTAQAPPNATVNRWFNTSGSGAHIPGPANGSDVTERLSTRQ